MRDSLDQYVELVKARAQNDHVRDNEQATAWSLVGPLFTLLGYDLTDPKQCAPQFWTGNRWFRHQANHGRFAALTKQGRADFALLDNGRPRIVVEVKPAGDKNLGCRKKQQQLARYFNNTKVRLGILTNGVLWLFYTNPDDGKYMDEDPFHRWDVLADVSPPHMLLECLVRLNFREYRLDMLRGQGVRESPFHPPEPRLAQPLCPTAHDEEDDLPRRHWPIECDDE